MNRIDYRAWSSVALFALVLGYAGCSANPTDAPPAANPKPTAAAAEAGITGPRGSDHGRIALQA